MDDEAVPHLIVYRYVSSIATHVSSQYRQQKGFKPKKNVWLSFVPDEEVGGSIPGALARNNWSSIKSLGLEEEVGGLIPGAFQARNSLSNKKRRTGRGGRRNNSRSLLGHK